uniref:Uncharacterized protein n=1 Tax=Oryza rufipogon TaxID=4529 RepID=A0A0E0NFA3_ORYRU
MTLNRHLGNATRVRKWSILREPRTHVGAVSSLEVSSCWLSLPSGENRVPFRMGVDSIFDVVPLLKASLRRFLHH